MYSEICENLPVDYTVGLVTTCNMCCEMCFRRWDPNKYSKDFIDDDVFQKLVNAMRTQKPEIIRWHCDGELLNEPAASKFLNTVVEMSADENCFSTNGQNIDHYIEKLVGTKLTLLIISVDAATEETYKKIRHANFSKLLNNIRKLNTYKEENNLSTPRLKFMFVLMEENKHELGLFVEIAKFLNVSEVEVMPLNTAVCSSSKLREVQLEEAKRVCKFAKANANESGIIFNFGYDA